MRVNADEVVAFCERHYRKRGLKFSLKGREWVRDEIFRPALGWKLWPRDADDLCDRHRAMVGEIHTWSPELVRKWARKQKCCAGLKPHKIMLLIVNIPRGGGKTTNTIALIFGLICLVPRMRVSFIASSGEQAQTIAKENILDMVEDSPQLRKHFTQVGNSLTFNRSHGAGSMLEVLNTSPKSLTSRRRAMVFADEARGIPADALSSLAFSLRAQSRFECPHNASHPIRPYEEDKVLKCGVCKGVMVPFLPTLVLTSTSGKREGKRTDFFDELVEYYADPDNQDPVTHIYRDTEIHNPDAHDVENMIFDALKKGSETLAGYVEAEQYNEPMVAGEDFLAAEELRAVFDDTLGNKKSSEELCIGYMDTSRVGDLTSLAIVEQDGDTWSKLRLAHLAYWNPRDRAQCPTRQIELEQIVAYLENLTPRFPNLVKLCVDTQGVKEGDDSPDWQAKMFRQWEAGEILKGLELVPSDRLYGKQQTKRKSAVWNNFHRLILAREFRTFPHPLIEREIRGLKVETKNEMTVIVDRNRAMSHADVTDSIANACFMAWELMNEKDSVGFDGVMRSKGLAEFLGSLKGEGGQFDRLGGVGTIF